MKTTTSRKRGQAKTWPKSVQPGRAIVKVYRRKTPAGNLAFMVANYADGERRRFDSYADEADAIAAATKLAQRLDSRDYVAASLTKQQAIEYASADARLKLFGVTVDAATATIVELLRIIGGFENLEKVKQAAAQGQPLPDLASLVAAVKFFRQRHKQIVKKSVPELVAEFLELKKSRGASPRYHKDLHWRLEKMFAADCTKEAANVTTTDIQDWLDAQKLAPQNYRNFRTTLNTLFEHARARSYTFDNPVEGVEKIKVPNGGRIAIFSPDEIAKLIIAASPAFLPVIVLGAFAGLRTAEIERLEWRDIDLAGGFIHISADKAKTASRRLVPVQANLAAWLATYAKHTGRVWKGTSNDLQEARAACVKESGVKWKDNGLRHSFISYRLAEIQDAAKVALEAGNSPNVVFKHYRELVKPSDAVKFFSVKPDAPANVLPMPAAAIANA
jgi:integrase